MRVLQIVHGLPPASSGGTEAYTFNLCRALARRPGVSVTVLTRDADEQRPELSVRRERRGAIDVYAINNTFAACTTFEESYRHSELCRVAAGIIGDVQPDVAHVQHLTALSTDIVAMLRSHDIPVVITLNDYWPICHRGQLLDLDGERCDGPGDAGCANCIPAGAIAPRGAWRAARRMRELPIPLVRSIPPLVERAAGMVARRGTSDLSAMRAAHMRAMLAEADVLLTPSPTLRERYIRFGIDPARLEPCDQGIETVAPCSRDAVSRSGPLRTGFAGSLMLSKAPHLLLDAIELLPRGAVAVDFLGQVAPYHGDPRYAIALERRLGHPSIRRYGPVPHERVAEALADVDVLVVPSIWIENAPFIIREAFTAGVPVVASDLGGMADMVRDGVNGLLFEPGSAASLASALQRLIDEPTLLPTLRAGISPVLSIDEDAARLHARYDALVRRRHAAPDRSIRDDDAKRAITAVILDYARSDETFLAARSIATSMDARADVVVVENGANRKAAASIRATLPHAHLIETATNVGFSAGCNAGITHALAAGADAVLLLNNDAVLHPHALRRLADVLWSDERIGLAAPVTVSREEPQIIASAGMRYDPRTGRMRHRAAGRRLAALGTAPVRRVDGVSGCAVLIKRGVFERAGLFDEDYFFSFEDLEFCLRARRAGFDTVMVSDALVYHEGGRTIGARSPRRVYYGVRNHLRLAQQVAPLPAVARWARGAAIVALSAAYVALSPEVPLLGGLAALARGTVHHLRGRYGAG